MRGAAGGQLFKHLRTLALGGASISLKVHGSPRDRTSPTSCPVPTQAAPQLTRRFRSLTSLSLVSVVLSLSSVLRYRGPLFPKSGSMPAFQPSEFCGRDFHPRNNVKNSGTVCSPPRDTRGSLSLSPGQPSVPRPPGRVLSGHTRAVSPGTKAKQVPCARDTATPTARPPPSSHPEYCKLGSGNLGKAPGSRERNPRRVRTHEALPAGQALTVTFPCEDGTANAVRTPTLPPPHDAPSQARTTAHPRLHPCARGGGEAPPGVARDGLRGGGGPRTGAAPPGSAAGARRDGGRGGPVSAVGARGGVPSPPQTSQARRSGSWVHRAQHSCCLIKGIFFCGLNRTP